MTYRIRTLNAMALTAALTVGLAGSAEAQTAEAQTVETEAVRRAMNQLKKVEAAQRRPQSTNIRVEVLLTDKADGKPVAEERLTFLLADWEAGSLRRRLPNRDKAWSRTFEVDAQPTIQGDRIKLALRVNYQAPRDTIPSADPKEIPEMVEFVQSVTSLLEPGKPMTMIDAYGDPANRRVSVQATATILK